ncbi:hypothetical protein BCR36DRAFT_587143 [Piromyces finnis]|uniref:Uncharacterized protein n=1 Tax=Piromyces finnis TaxID=1754191 RepID=A0A1Y1UWR4_9FUNG|nr:hypothetical protein BCR36DRAFT_587143 [Piromyces finnis]|eukprot:ORX42578.1 hypothetical protein BCR36DRAFT_587143 [Piromyces finnis]
MNFNISFLIFNILLFLNFITTKKCYIKKKNVNSENYKNGNVLNLTVNKNSVFTKTVSFDISSSSETELEDEYFKESHSKNSIIEALSTFIAEDDTLESLPTTFIAEDDAVESLPTTFTTEDDIVESSSTTSTTEDDAVESLPTTFIAEDDTLESLPTTFIAEDDAVESLPTTSTTEDDAVESLSTTSTTESSTMKSLPTAFTTEDDALESSSTTSTTETSTMESLPTTFITEDDILESSSTTFTTEDDIVESLPTTSIFEDDIVESLPTTFTTEDDIVESLPTTFTTEDDIVESLPTTSTTETSTMKSLPTTFITEDDIVESLPTTSTTETSTMESLPTNYCKNEITIDNSNFNIVYFKEKIMYDKCILSDFYINEETFNINSIMYCGKLYLNDNVEKYNIGMEKKLSIKFGIYIMEIEKVYQVEMVNSSNEKLCIDLNGKQNLEYKKEKINDFILVNYKEESSLFITNKNNEIIKKDCLNEIEYKVKPSLISSVKENLCGKEEHLLKIKNLINKNKNGVDATSTITTNIPEPTNEPENNCKDRNNNITYAEIENKTFNFGGYVLYNKNLCKVNLISNGPLNHYTLNPYKQKVQINGLIECIYYDVDGEEKKYDKKIRIESLDGARKFEILSDINPYADYTFFEPFKYTSTSNLSINDSLPDFSRGKFSMYNYITYYNDKEKREEIGKVKTSWIYNVIVGDSDDVWITC